MRGSNGMKTFETTTSSDFGNSFCLPEQLMVTLHAQNHSASSHLAEKDRIAKLLAEMDKDLEREINRINKEIQGMERLLAVL